jgi:hypothetical protein
MRIYAICDELMRLSRSEAVAEKTRDACAQATFLLEKMRGLVIVGRLEKVADHKIVDDLAYLLAQHQEG